MKKKLSYIQKYWISEVCAYLASVGVPLTTALVMFPPEILNETKMSLGLSVIVAGIVAITTFRQRVNKLFDGSKATGTTWLVITMIAIVTRYLADQLLVVGIVATIAGYGSIPIFNYADKNMELNKKLKEAEQEAEIEQIVKGTK